MPRLSRTILLSCALFALASAPAAHAQYDLATPEEEAAEEVHLKAITRLLLAMEHPKLLRPLLTPKPDMTREQREVMAYISARYSDWELCKIMSGRYSQYITTEDANTLAEYYEGPLGRRRVQRKLADIGMIDGQALAPLTAEEQQQVTRVEDSPAAQALRRVSTDLYLKDLSMVRSIIESDKSMLDWTAKDQLQRVANRYSNARSGEPEPALTLTPTGVAIYDEVIANLADTLQKLHAIGTRMEQELANFNPDRILAAERLASADGIARSRAELAGAESVMTRALTEMQAQLAVFQQRRQTLADSNKAGTPPLSFPAVDAAAKYMERLIVVQRRTFAQFRATLDQAQSRLP